LAVYALAWAVVRRRCRVEIFERHPGMETRVAGIVVQHD